ncbi:hypothetical protein ACZ11_07825 [Lysinibacillus xylanilyticus]|uniref:Uncharacterized protein n=1 Tax=Lysinibacillus xylanilyticus TaxID=582475 RepID=A0A0K9FCX2_9BACI|nr:hypothetical protein ACZ11_07825 [Lysinibacillus xylanilyticus]
MLRLDRAKILRKEIRNGTVIKEEVNISNCITLVNEVFTNAKEMIQRSGTSTRIATVGEIIYLNEKVDIKLPVTGQGSSRRNIRYSKRMIQFINLFILDGMDCFLK